MSSSAAETPAPCEASNTYEVPRLDGVVYRQTRQCAHEQGAGHDGKHVADFGIDLAEIREWGSVETPAQAELEERIEIIVGNLASAVAAYNEEPEMSSPEVVKQWAIESLLELVAAREGYWIEAILDWEGETPCRYDHHDQCQEHGLGTRPCLVDRARAAQS